MNKVNDKLSQTDDTNVVEVCEVKTPLEVINKYPLTDEVALFIRQSRVAVSNIISWTDDRLLVTVWPCSVHNPKEALEYAKYIKEMQEKYPNLLLVMRVYFEKPRTSVGWKWMINDPHLDWSYDIETGLEEARSLLLQINEMWVPVATEFLDTMSPQYFADLITWWAIWARTTESQLHRELASGLSAPIWFKNWTDWWIDIAINAIKSASNSHSFLSASKEWRISRVTTKWNENLHVILRWWSKSTNYDEKSVNEVIQKLEKNNINSWIMVDFSHSNSEWNFKNQLKVCESVANQIKKWNKKIMSVMIESNIIEWNQKFNPEIDDKTKLIPGLSITDACINLDDTTKVFEMLENAVEERRVG